MVSVDDGTEEPLDNIMQSRPPDLFGNKIKRKSSRINMMQVDVMPNFESKTDLLAPSQLSTPNIERSSQILSPNRKSSTNQRSNLQTLNDPTLPAHRTIKRQLNNPKRARD
jgi:hypothetical protein